MTINEYIYNWQGNMKEVEIPRIHLFKASPSKISKGESSLLTWESEDTTDCTIYDPIEDTSYPGLGTIGSLEVYPESTTIYEINCSGATSEVKVGVK